MKLEFNKEEMAILTAIVLVIGKDAENGVFKKDDGEIAEIAERAFQSLSYKVLMANLKIMASELESVMDAEILDEEE